MSTGQKKKEAGMVASKIDYDEFEVWFHIHGFRLFGEDHWLRYHDHDLEHKAFVSPRGEWTLYFPPVKARVGHFWDGPGKVRTIKLPTPHEMQETFEEGLRDIMPELEDLAKRGMLSRVVFQGGGDLQMPDFFTEFLKKLGVELVIVNGVGELGRAMEESESTRSPRYNFDGVEVTRGARKPRKQRPSVGAAGGKGEPQGEGHGN